MNYSLKKTNLRLVALLLTFLMIVGLFAGCKKNEPEGTTPSTEEAVPPGLVEVKPTEATTVPTEAPAPVDKNAAVINANQVSVRQTPSNDANPIGYLDKGTQVTIIREVSIANVGWTLIREGWVTSDSLDKSFVPEETTGDDETDTPAPEETKPNNNNGNSSASFIGYVSASELNIRKEANANSARVGAYKRGNKVTILETKNGWGRTDKGWIALEHVSQSSTDFDNNNNNSNNTNNNNTTNSVGTGTSTNAKGIITANELNIRKDATQNSDRVGAYKYGDRITIVETKDGWGRTDKGWISLNYVYQDGTKGNNGCKGVVIGDTLNVRSGPGTNYDRVNSLKYGTRVDVLQRITFGDTTWGCINGGWISLDHVYVDGTESVGAGIGSCTGDNVNIRSGPGTNYAAVGSANRDETITIYTQIEIGDITWGYIEKGNVKGWMSMQYANMG